MPAPELSSTVVRFDVFELDFQTCELRRRGQRVRLQEQPFRVLSLLLERAGEVVTRDELRQKLWPADTFVDFDHGLNSAVGRLREALRDSADSPRFIATIAKRGYRFIAPLADTPLVQCTPAVPAVPRKARILFIGKWAIAVGLVLLSAAGVLAFYKRNRESTPALIQVVPLIGLRGFQATPALSPDGRLVAFLQSDGAHNTGIYTALVGGEKSVQLSTDPGDCCPTWSPDGRQVAFTRYFDNTVSIELVPALGGTARSVNRTQASMGVGIAWSPDGNILAISESSKLETPRCWISLLSLADSTTRKLTSPPGGSADREPAFSPDGEHVAFVRSTIAGVSNDIFVISTKGGEAKRLTFDNRPIMGPPAWTTDGREIVFSSDRGVATGLWRVAASGGTPHPVAGPVGEASWPSIPAKGNVLAYEQTLSKFNLWRLELKNARTSQGQPLAVISEKGDKMRPDISPDGKKIAFESNRMGFWDIWTCNRDGSDCEQLTALHGTAGRARWSPNGRYVAFEFHPTERSEIYVVEVPGGVPKLLATIPGSDNLSPSWSRDGKWLYFASKRDSEPFQIWKMPLQGGSPIKLTRNGGISPVESHDGRFLYYSKYEQGGVWRMPLQGGAETEVLRDVQGGGWPNWGITSSGIYYLKLDQFPRVSIQFFEFATRRSIPIYILRNKPGWGLSVSSDGKSIVYVQGEFAESDVMLVKNFR